MSFAGSSFRASWQRPYSGCSGTPFLRNALSSGTTLVESVLLSTGHYWFLLAILLIFMVVGPLNALPRHRAAFALSSGCVALSLIWGRLTLPADGLLRISNAVYLAPSFLLGVIANREGATLLTRNGPVLAGAACLMGYGLYLNLGTYAETGRLSLGRMDAQSLGVGIGAILLVSCLVPKRRLPDRLAVCAFTVYLCHPIGTSGARRLFDAIGEEAGFVRFALGTAAGFGVPIPIHRIAARMDWSRRALPGLRAKRQGALVAT